MFRKSALCILLLCGLASISGPSRAAEPQCEAISERQILDAILNLDFAQARAVVRTFNLEHALIPSEQYYSGLIEWAEGTANRDKKQSREGIRVLTFSVSQLEATYKQSPTISNRIAWDLAATYTARILAIEERFLASYNIGYRAIKSLHQLVRTGLLDKQQSIAANFALGVYYLYLNNLPDSIKWAKILLKITGTLDEGLTNIIAAVQESIYLGPEAARVLLLEAPWRPSVICSYLEVSMTLAMVYPRNPDFSLVYQGLLLRCGYTKESMNEHERFVNSINNEKIRGFSPVDYTDLFDLSRIRNMVAEQNLHGLTSYRPENSRLTPYLNLAVANIHDMQQNYSRSRKFYNDIINDADSPIHLKTVPQNNGSFSLTRKLNSRARVRLSDYNTVNHRLLFQCLITQP